MALQIKNKNEAFHLIGHLKSDQVFEIKAFFKSILQNRNNVTVSIEALDQIDLSGALLLAQLQEDARKEAKLFTISGWQNKKVLGAFRMLSNFEIPQVA